MICSINNILKNCKLDNRILPVWSANGLGVDPNSNSIHRFCEMETLRKKWGYAKQRYNEIILLDNAIDSGFCASAKELIRLQGIDTFNWYTRGTHDLSSARLRSIKSFHDWCVANGLMK